MKKKIPVILLSLILAAFPCGIASGEPAGVIAAAQSESVENPVKDETVYVSLDAGGALQELSVVNRFETPRDGVYTDYGAYESVINLTNAVQPETGEGAVSWQLSANSAGFYYQGKLAGGEPPFLFTVKYLLDGKETDAAALAGKSGRVTVHVEMQPNAAANEHYRENYFCQVQASLDLDACRNIEADGATRILTGRSLSLAYTALPGKTASFDIAFDTDGFTFGGFTATAMPFDQKSLTGIDISGFDDDIQKMADGTQELVDGTKTLKDGLGELAGGVKKLANGAGDAQSGLGTYKKGLKSYAGGVSELAVNAKTLAETMGQLAQNGEQLKQGYAALSAGLDAMLAGFAPMSPPDTATQITALRGQLTAYGANLNAYIDGVSQMAGGMQAFSAGVSKLKNPGSELVAGLGEIISGISKLADGLETAAREMNKLPGEVQKLVDGQTELHDGVLEAQDMFKAWDMGGDAGANPVSFTSEKNAPRSVQFIFKTAEIAVEKDNVKPEAPETVKKGFFEKLAELFK